MRGLRRKAPAMTADRTDAVLQAIDGALDDWSVSGDAMRWTPEVEPQFVGYVPRHTEARAVLTNVTSTVDDDGEWTVVGTLADEYVPSYAEQVRAIREATYPPPSPLAWPLFDFGASAIAIREAAARAAEQAWGTIRDFTEAMEASRAAFAASPERNALADLVCRAFDVPRSVVDPSPADLVRARALQARRTRNTGPARAPAGRQKRPREL